MKKEKTDEVISKGSEKLGQRQTKQRNIILKVLEESGGPLHIQQILQKSRKELSAVGIATVYRTLKILSDNNLVESLILPDGETCYEIKSAHHHDHFICKKCKKVFDMEFCLMSFPKGTLLPGDFEVEHHTATFYGFCSECR